MAIDFTRIETGDDFEFLVQDIFKGKGAQIISGPARGVDGGKDLVVRLSSSDDFGNTTYFKYVVQCKHYAKSGKAVAQSDVSDWRDVCELHNADGYYLVTSTMLTSKLETILTGSKQLRNLYWDKSRLEEQIVMSPIYAELVRKYNLQDSIEVIFEQAKSILLGEYHLPFTHSETLEENTYKGLIFTRTELDNKFNTVIKKIGFFCFLDLNNLNFIQSIRESFDIDDLNIIDDSSTYPNSISLSDLYSQLQGFRDTYYQDAIWTALSCCYQNPTAIRVIESSLRNMPYQQFPLK